MYWCSCGVVWRGWAVEHWGSAVGLFAEAVEQWSVLWGGWQRLLNSGQCCGVVCRGCSELGTYCLRQQVIR
jgi:hypothetical protein